MSLPAAPALFATAAAALGPLLAMGSPWWEDYGINDTYLCPGDGRIVVERNEAQASLITGQSRTTLFRQTEPAPGEEAIMGTVYRNELLTLILRGDQLIIEQLPKRTSCMRTESV